MKKHRELFILILFFIITFAYRYWSIQGHKLQFGFDQSRDALVSREIIENKDFKILGPSASGTNDTVYHGVLYYYIIGPLYTLGQGDPEIAALGLAVIASFSIIPIYFLTKDITKSVNWATVALLLFAFSTENAQLTTWLSNPSLAILSISLYYWSLYRVFIKEDRKFIGVLFLSAGINIQSALWLIYYIFPITAGVIWFWYQPSKRKWLLNQKTYFFLGLLIFSLTLSTIVLAQLKLWNAGVFNLNQLGKATFRDQSFHLDSITRFFSIYIEKSLKSILPTFPIASLLVFLWLTSVLKKLTFHSKLFFLVWFFAPMGLFIWHSRNNLHILIGIEICLLILFTVGLQQITKNTLRPFNQLLPIMLISAYLLSQIQLATNSRQLRLSTFSQQSGTFLSDQLLLVDATYALANGQPFSISTYTNPLGYNITWTYLYDWYGLNKYGYKPQLYGFDQKGLFGERLITMAKQPESIHFSIIEPEVGAPNYLLTKFIIEQEAVAPLLKETSFGSTRLQQRIFNHKSSL